VHTIDTLIKTLDLKAHPEGGWYAETYRSAGIIKHESSAANFTGDRSFSTAIYFLLPAGVFSAFHRIKSDECWHFYEGTELNIYVIDKSGVLQIIRLGNDLLQGETFQAVVPAGCWFASKPATDSGYSLVGCTVAPGFDFADFELADADALAREYSQHETLIRSLCR
jgi:predicted cupin superfamily sugar epimerase